MAKKKPAPTPEPFVFPRADPAELAKFDERTKVCTMNCGPHRDDPRPRKEWLFMCDDCEVRDAPKRQAE